MIFTARADGTFEIGDRRGPCALGRSGVIAAADKREGDGASPLGDWPIRRVLYRPDKGAAPRTDLAVRAIEANDGWCDAPSDAAYNQPVTLPYPASAEAMWRDDDVYDLVVVLGHNDDPVEAGMGSAIFMHLAKPGYPPTEGCVALARADLEAVLALAAPGDVVRIVAESTTSPPVGD